VSDTDASIIVLHRKAAPEGEEEPEHDTSGDTCWCGPFRYGSTDPRYATPAQVEVAASMWFERWSS
jgi:hypothetical protein